MAGFFMNLLFLIKYGFVRPFDGDQTSFDYGKVNSFRKAFMFLMVDKLIFFSTLNRKLT